MGEFSAHEHFIQPLYAISVAQNGRIGGRDGEMQSVHILDHFVMWSKQLSNSYMKLFVKA